MRGRVPNDGGILLYRKMNVKHIPIGFALLLTACAASALFIGSLRPFGDTEKFSAYAPPTSAQTQPTAAPTLTSAPLPTNQVAVTRVAFIATKSAQANTATPTPSAQTVDATPTIAPAQATADALATQTFAPAQATADALATQTSAPAQATFDAIATRAIATPAATRPSHPDRAIHKTTNFLLIGTDTRTTDPNWKPNTDVMMVLFLDTANQRAALLSLPRDLVVAIPGHQAFRLNTAYKSGWEKGSVAGGIAILKQVLSDEFDIRIDHWALIDFNGLNKIVDTLGGIQVNVPCALTDTIDEQTFTIPAGDVNMDYVTTKRYVQSRYTTSDTSRNFRQQRVVWAIMKKALSMNAPDRVPALYEQLNQSIATDMTLLQMVALVPATYQLDLQNHPERLHAQVMQAPVVYSWVSSNGAWLYMPDYVLIQKMLDEIFDAPQIAASQPSPAECPAQPAAPAPTDTPTPTPTP